MGLPGRAGRAAAIQALVTALSGSVALLGDTLHNAADALTAVPLGIAFLAGPRPASRRYTYGYGRAEDLAGVLVVAVIAVSAALAATQAIGRLAHPRPVTGLAAVALAALAGCAGNEVAARYRIRTGRAIGSAALVADGLHARADGLASLAVLLAAGGAALGWRWADPAVGLLITVAILAVLRQAARDVFRRLMDAVDPALVDTAEAALLGTPGVLGAGAGPAALDRAPAAGRMRRDRGRGGQPVAAHQVAAAAEHRLRHALPKLASATVHADPAPVPGTDHHALLAAHR